MRVCYVLSCFLSFAISTTRMPHLCAVLTLTLSLLFFCFSFDRPLPRFFFFFFNDTATTEIYTLSLHDALPISELLPRRIRVNVVSPGPTETEIFKRGESPAQIEAVRSSLGGAVPMKRMGEPEEEIGRAHV